MEQVNEISLKFSESPLCPIAADVISDGESIYFYMYDLDFENERLVARSACWVKNLVAAPKSFDKIRIEDDRQPVLPQMFVDETMDIAPWNEEDIEIEWSKEGHIASLFYKHEVVSVIPSWADGHNFTGYARYAKENSMVAWKLTDASTLLSRIEEGRKFWNQEFNRLWESYNTSYISQLYTLYVTSAAVYDLHKDMFPSRLLLTFEKDDMIFAFTVGVGMFSMPNTDRYFNEYEAKAKTEFAIRFKKGTLSETEIMDVYASIAGVCNVPWHTMNCIAHGHILDMKFQDADNCMIIDDDTLEQPLSLDIKKEGVHISWIVPISTTDYNELQDEKKKDICTDKIIKGYGHI